VSRGKPEGSTGIAGVRPEGKHGEFAVAIYSMICDMLCLGGLDTIQGYVGLFLKTSDN